jgi:hypothetical protein
MAAVSVTVALFLAVLMQEGGLPTGPMPEGLSSYDRSRLTAAAQNVEKRIKIYTEVSNNRRRSVEKSVAEQDFDSVTLILRSWTEVLDFSLRDIRANAGKKARSGALKNYEIQLRKAITAVSDLKTKGSYEQLEKFESWLNHADEVQKKIVAILFPG